MKAFLYLGETFLGELSVESVRGHETWMFAYDADYLKVPRPMLDPEIANVPGPQYSSGGGMFGFLADCAPFYRYTKAEAEARYAAIEEICRGF